MLVNQEAGQELQIIEIHDIMKLYSPSLDRVSFDLSILYERKKKDDKGVTLASWYNFFALSPWATSTQHTIMILVLGLFEQTHCVHWVTFLGTVAGLKLMVSTWEQGVFTGFMRNIRGPATSVLSFHSDDGFAAVFALKMVLLVGLQYLIIHFEAGQKNLYMASVLRKLKYFVFRIVFPEAMLFGLRRVNHLSGLDLMEKLDYLFWHCRPELPDLATHGLFDDLQGTGILEAACRGDADHGQHEPES